MKFIDSAYFAMLKPELAAIRGPGDFAGHVDEMNRFLATIPGSRSSHAYAPGKWTVSEVVGHFTDAQLVFLNRILFIGRGEACVLPGFDENLWVPNSGHAALGLGAVRETYERTAALTLAVVGGLPPEAWSREGVANGLEIRVEEILVYVMAHEKHHMAVLRDRYLK